MPRRYPCPECAEPVVTFLKIGETATCSACGVESAVPEGAAETEPTTPNLPERGRSPLDRDLSHFSRLAAHQRALVCGLAGVALAVLFWLIGLAAVPMDWNDILTMAAAYFAPILFIGGIILVGAALVARGLDAIRAELEKGRSD